MAYTPSCDTMVVTRAASAKKRNIFGKNSDRDAAEAQLIEYYPPADHSIGEKLKCTYITIDQVPHTYGMIGSRPWWIWGFEMGTNECGVTIGNEAEWSNVPVPEEEALLGMDLLRLGLERGSTAREALAVIIDLLEKYGQGGACRFGSTAKDSGYHNAFMLMDKDEAYLLETVSRHWAWKKIEGARSISNIYSLEDDYDEASAGIEDFAREMGLEVDEGKLNFSKTFLLLNYHYMGGFYRLNWANEELQKKSGSLTPESVRKILQGHYEGTFMENRWSSVGGFVPCVCMHGCRPTGTQTAASCIVEYHDSPYKELAFTYWASLTPPCCSVSIPLFNIGYVPKQLGIGGGTYSQNSFWWRQNRMTSDVEMNYAKYHPWIEKVQFPVEKLIRESAASARKEAEALFKAGKPEEAKAVLRVCTDDCFSLIKEDVEKMIIRIETDLKNDPPSSYRRKYLQEYRAKTEIPEL